ncbi:MAG: zf-HC2 domain-containing protein, partial [Gemmatimonadota bacterium]
MRCDEIVAFLYPFLDGEFDTLEQAEYEAHLLVCEGCRQRVEMERWILVQVRSEGTKTPLAPEKEDHMIIDPVPDIFLTGHTHSFGVEVYKKILLINGSTWQSQTDYQKMHNFDPDPAKATVVNLRTLRHKILDFSSG